MYKIFVDRPENFTCDIKLEGANLSDSFARVILETEGINLVFNGKINSSGKCEIPINRVKGILKEGITGNMKLEVIADETYFVPWKSNFIVDRAKKVKATVVEQKVYSKPKIIVSNVKEEKKVPIVRKKSTVSLREGIKETAKKLVTRGIKSTNARKNQKIIKNEIKHYLLEHKELNKEKFVKAVIKIVSKIK
tara:strand:- start:547 stop:1125 length:579 start_codon:yes stop_codon:yes gene_type:complete